MSNIPIENTNFPNGFTNRNAAHIFGSLKMPDPTRYHTFFEDFHFFTPEDWSIVVDGSGRHFAANGHGSPLLVDTGTAADNGVYIQHPNKVYNFELGKSLYFKYRFKISDANLAHYKVGFYTLDIDPFGSSSVDGVFFHKPSGTNTISIVSQNDQDLVSQEVATMVDDTSIDLSCYWDGRGTISVSADDGSIEAFTPSNLSLDVFMHLSFALGNGEAATKAAYTDYIFAARER